MQTNFIKFLRPIFAIFLLVIYVFVVGDMISEIWSCGRNTSPISEECKQPFPGGKTIIVTSIGGLISALVVAHVAKAGNGSTMASIYVGPSASQKRQRAAKYIIDGYIFVWFGAGAISLVVGVLMYPDVKDVVGEIGTNWIGVIIASVYAYLGLKPAGS